MASVRFLLRSCYSAMLVLLLMRHVFALPVASESDEPEPVFANIQSDLPEGLSCVKIRGKKLVLQATEDHDISNVTVYYNQSVSSLDFVVENPLTSVKHCKQWFSYGGCNITLEWDSAADSAEVKRVDKEDKGKLLGTKAQVQGKSVKFRFNDSVVDISDLPRVSCCPLQPGESQSGYHKINISMGLVTENECKMNVSFDNSIYKVLATTTTPPPPITTLSSSVSTTTSSPTRDQSASSSHVDATEPSTTKKVCTYSKRQGGDYLDIIFFVFFGLSAIFLILALMFVLWCYRRSRRFEKKFGPPKGLGSADATKGSADAILLQGKTLPPSDADMSLKSFVQPDEELNKEDSAGHAYHADVKKAGVYDTLGPVRHNANHYEVIGDLNSTEQLQQ